MAVLWAVRYLKYCILEISFIIVAYQESLRALNTKKPLEGRILNWFEALYKHDYTIL